MYIMKNHLVARPTDEPPTKENAAYQYIIFTKEGEKHKLTTIPKTAKLLAESMGLENISLRDAKQKGFM